MKMIWSSCARNRSPDPVVSCFFGRIAPSDTATESRFSIRGNPKTKLQASSASDPETLQSQVTKTARKRLSLRGLEVLHGRRTASPLRPCLSFRYTQVVDRISMALDYRPGRLSLPKIYPRVATV